MSKLAALALAAMPLAAMCLGGCGLHPLYAGGRLSAGVEHARALYEESVDGCADGAVTE